MTTIPVTLRSDEKGYLDRECPNEDCLYTFKILMKDWDEKVSDKMYCPLCGHIDSTDKWWTQDQLEKMKDIASSWAMDYIGKELDKVFGDFARSTRNNKFMRVTYKPGRRTTFVNNPIGQREEWETEICCEKCGTHYSVIGAAYFCPCCGYNSALNSYNDSLDSIKNMLESLNDMKQMLTERLDADSAETMYRGLLENTIGNMVSAFQKFAASKYEELSGKKARVNDFQIVEKGNGLFQSATGKGYNNWLSDDELFQMNVLFQKRHLLEHNNGMVDQVYLDKSHDSSYALGQRIVIKEGEAYSLLSILRKLGNGLIELRVGG